MSLPAPTPFHVLDQGTLFVADQVWHNVDGELESCQGAWDFAHVSGVLAPTPSQFPTVDGPTCALLWMGEHLHLRAEFSRVLAAWRRYRRQHGGPAKGTPLQHFYAN